MIAFFAALAIAWLAAAVRRAIAARSGPPAGPSSDTPEISRRAALSDKVGTGISTLSSFSR